MKLSLPSTATDVPALIGIRRLASNSFVAVLWALAVLNATVAFFSGMNVWLSAGFSLAGAVIGTVANLKDRDGLFGRLVIVVGLMDSYDVLIYATSYTPYQLDAHMLYFVLAALIISYCCWTTLLAACLHTAVQHFVFNLLLPHYLYPAGADWIRFFYHAAILVTQVAGSMACAVYFHRLFDQNHRMLSEVRKAAAEATAVRQREDAQRSESLAERSRLEAVAAAAARTQGEVVDAISTGLERLADGELVYRIQLAFASDYEKLRTTFNEAMVKLESTMKGVAEKTSAIRSSTGSISAAAEDLSRRTENQASTLQETASSLSQITSTVNKTAEAARHARDIVNEAKEGAKESGAVVQNAIKAMTGIERSSRQITDIIGVIDEIAFQTNLLALNAGVEAARAGDAGRGFAVVASEVRALAQRSAEAAKQIKGLILTSTGQVSRGVELVAETGKSLERIADQVGKINNVVSEIAARAQDQANGLQEVNAAVGQFDQVTHQNAAMVEQTTAATHALAMDTEELGQTIASFRVQGSAVPSQRKVA